MPSSRFVILRHECPADAPRPTHWDVMLEHAGALMTWALAEFPRSGQTIDALRLADHRLVYLDYEGEVSAGRGSVARYDRGPFTFIEHGVDGIVAELAGETLRGRLTLRRVSDERWLCRWEETACAGQPFVNQDGS